MKPKRGFTLVELLVVMSIIALLMSLLLPALLKAKQKANLLKDQAQIKEVHQAWLTYAPDHKGLFPVPGLINRKDALMADGTSRPIPGRGDEDSQRNTHANLHSVLIMQNYYDPSLCVGPTEPSGSVFVKDDYNWDIANTVTDIYWDETFASDLTANSNVSYASMLLGGPARKDHWRNTMDSQFAVLGNRGVQAGKDDVENVYNNSITLKTHGPDKLWEGNICYNDNHVELHDTFWPDGIVYRDTSGGAGVVQSFDDNIFSKQTPTIDASAIFVKADNTDIFLCLTKIETPVVGRFFLAWD